MVATFIESLVAGQFLPDNPGLYWIPFHLRHVSPPRITQIPSPPSTYCLRSSSLTGIWTLLNRENHCAERRVVRSLAGRVSIPTHGRELSTKKWRTLTPANTIYRDFISG